MQLLVPTNWDIELLKPLGELEADVQIYGVLPTSAIGSGMTGPDVPEMTAQRAEKYIRQAHEAGLVFNYLLNTPCMGNREWQEDSHREILAHLDWINRVNVDFVTVAIPYLLEIIKRQFPRLKVEVSTIAHVNSVARAKMFEEIGVDSIILDTNINRDFKLLEAIRDAVSCKLGVLTNSLCLYQCPYEYYHNNTMGHASQTHSQTDGRCMDYCLMHCAAARLEDSSQFIKSRWIRPEDLSVYEKIGIDFFKIGGRAMPTEWILRSADAYARRHYQGNLYDILAVLEPKTDTIDVASGSRQSMQAASPAVYIDNQALEGFIDFFKQQDCVSSCAHCRYCQKIADKVVRFDAKEAKEYTALLNHSLDRLNSSEMFSSISEERAHHQRAGLSFVCPDAP
jgi:collagenase-like PrtC family protease